MHYAIFDNEGNALQWFDDEEKATEALDLWASQKNLLGDLALIAFDESGAIEGAEVRSANTQARFVTFVNSILESEALEFGVPSSPPPTWSTSRVLEVTLN